MGAERPMRFALQLSAAENGAAWAAAARRAEADGYDVLSVPDHLGPQFAPLVALAAAAASTRSIGLGTFVLAVGLRNPGMLAKEVATLDVLSGGRVELGLGAGWSAREFAALGVPFPDPPARLAQLAEVVALLRAVWRDEEVAPPGSGPDGATGPDRLRVAPQPSRPGGPPIAVGGGGRSVLRLAGRVADIVSIATDNARRTAATGLDGVPGWDRLARQVEWVSEGAAGRAETPERNLRVLAVVAGADPRRAAAELSATAGGSVDELVASPFVLLGRPAEMVGHLVRLRRELGITYFTVSARHAGALGPALEELAAAGLRPAPVAPAPAVATR